MSILKTKIHTKNYFTVKRLSGEPNGLNWLYKWKVSRKINESDKSFYNIQGITKEQELDENYFTLIPYCYIIFNEKTPENDIFTVSCEVKIPDENINICESYTIQQVVVEDGLKIVELDDLNINSECIHPYLNNSDNIYDVITIINNDAIKTNEEIPDFVTLSINSGKFVNNSLSNLTSTIKSSVYQENGIYKTSNRIILDAVPNNAGYYITAFSQKGNLISNIKKLNISVTPNDLVLQIISNLPINSIHKNSLTNTINPIFYNQINCINHSYFDKEKTNVKIYRYLCFGLPSDNNLNINNRQLILNNKFSEIETEYLFKDDIYANLFINNIGEGGVTFVYQVVFTKIINNVETECISIGYINKRVNFEDCPTNILFGNFNYNVQKCPTTIFHPNISSELTITSKIEVFIPCIGSVCETTKLEKFEPCISIICETTKLESFEPCFINCETTKLESFEPCFIDCETTKLESFETCISTTCVTTRLESFEPCISIICETTRLESFEPCFRDCQTTRLESFEPCFRDCQTTRLESFEPCFYNYYHIEPSQNLDTVIKVNYLYTIPHYTQIGKLDKSIDNVFKIFKDFSITSNLK